MELRKAATGKYSINNTTQKGGNVSYNDPHIDSVQTHNCASLESISLTAETLANADCVVLTTNHSAFDVEFIQKHAKLIVACPVKSFSFHRDMRNMITEASDKVYKL